MTPSVGLVSLGKHGALPKCISGHFLQKAPNVPLVRIPGNIATQGYSIVSLLPFICLIL